jgi:intein/homing endonuclease
MSDKVQGRSFTSNHVKLLKHMDKLQLIQDGAPPSPVMVHMSIINACNLTCSFCCFANRDLTDRLDTARAKRAIESFKKIGVNALEFSLRADEIIPFKKDGLLWIDTIQNLVRGGADVESFSISDNLDFVEDTITAMYEHTQTEPMYKLTLEGGANITTTGSHSVYFWSDGMVKKPVKEAVVGDRVIVLDKPLVPETLVETIELGGAKYVVDGDFCRLLGYFMAEGSFTFQRDSVPHGIVFTFGPYDLPREKKNIDDTCIILEKIGFTSTVEKHPNKTNIRVSRKSLCELFIHIGGGRGAKNKRVPNLIFNVSDSNKIEFLKGMYGGDGNFRSTVSRVKFNRNVLSYKTASKATSQTVSLLLRSLGVRCTMTEEVMKERTIEGRTLESGKCYRIEVSNRPSLSILADIVSFIGGELKYKESVYSRCGSRHTDIKVGEDFAAVRVKKIEIIEDTDELVYDISVGNTQRFVSSYGIVASNTGGGEPTIHPDFCEIVTYAKDLGFSLGLCTNGKLLGTKIPKEIVAKFSWVRLGLYGFYEGYSYDLSVFEGTNTTISAAYVWDENVQTSSNPNITGEWSDPNKKRLATKFQNRESFFRMIDWVEQNKVPTRIAFNAIKPLHEVEKDIATIKEVMGEMDLKYAFLSDFNFKGERRNDHCYMHMVKPFLFTDGYIYACPSAELSLENNYNYVPESQFMVCKMEDIEEYYAQPASVRFHACKYCKYAIQNELVDDIVLETAHNEFA